MMNKGILYKIFIIPLLLCFLVCPFHIYADTQITTSNITGCHITDKWLNDGTVYNNVTCDMDDNYYGSANMSIQYYIGSSTAASQVGYYVTVSGNSFDVVITTSNQSINSQKAITVIQINSNNIYKIDNINDSLMWMYPIESIGVIMPCFVRNMTLTDKYMMGQYLFPIFEIKNEDVVLEYRLNPSGDPNGEKYFIFGIGDLTLYNDASLNRYLINSNSNASFQHIALSIPVRVGGVNSSIEIAKLVNNSSQTIEGTITYKRSSNTWFMPIYYSATNNENLSTDFALQFGLKNSFLKNIEIIASGTSSSSSSSDNLETVSDDISSSSDDLIQSENSFNNSMNNNLQQIDTNINIGNLGSKFLASADWVRMQFNTLTNGTPFGSVLSFSLLLGLALVLVGRIRK